MHFESQKLLQKLDAAQASLLSLGHEQHFPRVLPWHHNVAICFCILASVAEMTGALAVALMVDEDFSQ